MQKFLLLIAFINITIYSSETSQNIAPRPDTWLIVFIHGIISVKPCLTFPNIIKFIRGRIAHTAYERTIYFTRQDPFFFQYHPTQHPGLHKIHMKSQKPGNTASAFAQIFERMHAFCGITNRINHYYTFGWSGLLNHKMRHLESKILYDALLLEVKKFQKKGINPKICLVSYSHGGNIALKLGEVYVAEQYPPENKLTVDQLIFFGLPVVPETDYFINSDIFKRVYHIYSFGDRVQRLDIFSLNRLSSNRLFHKRSDFSLPSKLVQIELRIRRPIKLKEQLYPEKKDWLDFLTNRRKMRNADPGHSELWSFGWAPTGYRKNFPLYPMPAAVLAPNIIHEVERYYPHANKLIFEFHPYYEKLICYQPYEHSAQVLPSLSHSQLHEVKQLAAQFEPANYSPQEFNQRIIYAKQKARYEWLKERNIKRWKWSRTIIQESEEEKMSPGRLPGDINS